MDYFNNINLNHNELQKAVIHPLATEPATHKAGQMYFNTTDNKLYYYDSTKWVALNDVDISGKLDKVISPTTYDQVYIKKTNGVQSMQDMSASASANTLALRGTNGRLKIGDAIDDNDAVTLKQLNNAIEAGENAYEHVSNKVGAITDSGDNVKYPNTKAVVEYVKGQVSKVKDVTLDGTSIVDTETGVVALESTYSTTLTGTSGTLTQEQYDNLSGDDASYIWYTQTGVQPIRLTKVMSGEGSLLYQAVASDIVMAVGIQSDKTWGFAQFNVEDAANKKTAIADGGNDTDYPTTKAVADYVGDNTAPKDHATADTTYGVGTTQKYGHVKLVTGDMKDRANEDGQVPSLDHEHSQYALLSGATFTGAVTIGGNLTVNGTTTTIESTTLAVKDKLIEVASGNTERLTTPAGLVVPKYDGTKNGALVFDGDGIAYVGDVTLNANGDIDVTKSNLVALAGREKTIAGGNLVKWDATNQIFVDTGIAASNIVTTDTTQTITASKEFDGEVAFDNHIRANGSVGDAGQVLTSQGRDKAPQWTTLIIPQGTVRKLAWSIVGDGATTMFENNNTLATAECTVSVYLQVSGATWELVMTDVIVTAAKIQIKFAQAPTNGQSFRVVVTG